MNKNMNHRRIGHLALLFALTTSSTALAFQTSTSMPPNTKQNAQQVFNSRQLQKTSTSSLYLFGMNTKDDKEPIEVVVVEEEETLLKKVVSFSKVALPSFLAGGVVTLGFLFLPLVVDYYDAFNGASLDDISGKMASTSGKNNNANNPNKVNQPVLLFETILNDLNEAYVDDVDVQKLFETGVKAMTASLDPYTEFESRLEAQEMQETVTGKYGGVGLVIRGGNNLKDLEDEIMLEDKGDNNNVEKIEAPTSPSNNEKPTTTIDTSSPPVAVKDAGVEKLEQKSPSIKKGIITDDEEDIDAKERKRALKKSMEEGIRVVSAFEGESSHDICFIVLECRYLHFLRFNISNHSFLVLQDMHTMLECVWETNFSRLMTLKSPQRRLWMRYGIICVEILARLYRLLF